jgi:HAD superfamily hydrolase (TIGR01548 family)
VNSLLIFDMDGVLVQVGASYRETIRRTVAHFTGKTVSNEELQDMKNQGGWNDDWALSFHLIRTAGVEVGFDTVVAKFQAIFRGTNGQPGLIDLERWTAQPGLFDRLKQHHRLAIFTGRLREEARVTLDRFAPDLFEMVVGTDDVQAGKPDPEGIIKIRAAIPHTSVFYLGDTVDDARSARSAGVPFIGIVGPETPRRENAVAALKSNGAFVVLESINEIEEHLP